MNRELRKRLFHSSLRLSFLSEEKIKEIREQNEALPGPDEEEGTGTNYPTGLPEHKDGLPDDATAQGPRSTRNNSRYKLEPGHSQHLSDLLSRTAERLRELL